MRVRGRSPASDRQRAATHGREAARERQRESAAISAARSVRRELVEHAVDEAMAVGGAERLRELDRLVDHDAVRNVERAHFSSHAPITRIARSIGDSSAALRVEMRRERGDQRVVVAA